MYLNLCLDDIGYKTKPDKMEIKRINQRMNFTGISVDATLLPDLIGNKGQTWTPAVFGYLFRRENSFKEEQLLLCHVCAINNANIAKMMLSNLSTYAM